MVRKSAVIMLVGAMGFLLCISCHPGKSPRATLTPSLTLAPTKTTGRTSTATRTSTSTPTPTLTLTSTPTHTPTPTPYIPGSRGTPLPPANEPITVQSAKSVILLAKWKLDTSPNPAIAFSPDSRLIYVGDEIYRLVDGVGTAVLEGELPSYLHDAEPLQSVSLDGRFSANIDYVGDLVITNPKAPTTALRYYLDDANNVFFYPDSRYMLVTFKGGQIWFVAISSWEPRLLALGAEESYAAHDLRHELVIDTQNKGIQAIFVSSDGSRMALIFSDDSMQIWSVLDLTQRLTINNLTPLTRLAFSPANSLFATSSDDNLIRLYDTQNGELLAELKGHPDKITSLAFSPNGRLLASSGNDGLYIWGILPDVGLQAAESTATAITRLSPTATRTQVSLPRPSPTPTSILPGFEALLPLPWPVGMPSDEQIDEAASCEVDALAKDRYPTSLEYWDLETAYPVQTACDWAALAAAYIHHSQDENTIPEEGKRAFVQAFSQNPALAMKLPVFYYYYNSFVLVSPPPFTYQPITSVEIDYEWGGMGEPSNISYHVMIKNANLSADKVKVTIQAQPTDVLNHVTYAITPTLVQAIQPALVNFLPIRAPFKLDFYTDNNPEWHVSLTFQDGTQLTLDTYHSDLLTEGGPWQAEIDGQYYLQFSTDLTVVFFDLFKALNLPIGEPMATTYSWENVFNLAYP